MTNFYSHFKWVVKSFRFVKLFFRQNSIFAERINTSSSSQDVVVVSSTCCFFRLEIQHPWKHSTLSASTELQLSKRHASFKPVSANLAALVILLFTSNELTVSSVGFVIFGCQIYGQAIRLTSSRPGCSRLMMPKKISWASRSARTQNSQQNCPELIAPLSLTTEKTDAAPDSFSCQLMDG